MVQAVYNLVLGTQNFKVPPLSQTERGTGIWVSRSPGFLTYYLPRYELPHFSEAIHSCESSPLLPHFLYLQTEAKPEHLKSNKTFCSTQNQRFQLIHTNQKIFGQWAKRKDRCFQYYWFHVHANLGLKLHH